MGNSSLIRRNVKAAFKAVGDLAIDVILSRTVVTDYSFAAKAVVASAPQTKVIKAIKVEKKNPREPSQAVITSLIFMSEDLDSPDTYDKCTFGGAEWNVVPPFVDNGYTVTVDVVRVT